MSEGPIRIGWTTANAAPDYDLGGDDCSWAYDGHCEEKHHGGASDTYGKLWQVGDIVGVFLDLTDHAISMFARATISSDFVGEKIRQFYPSEFFRNQRYEKL